VKIKKEMHSQKK